MDMSIASKANCILGFIKSRVGRRATDGILLCSHESPAGGLHAPLALSKQEKYGPLGAGPEESSEDDQKAGAPLLGGKAERDESVLKKSW